jgi:hypothetical protein
VQKHASDFLQRKGVVSGGLLCFMKCPDGAGDVSFEEASPGRFQKLSC